MVLSRISRLVPSLGLAVVLLVGCSGVREGSALRVPDEHGWTNDSRPIGSVFSDGMEILKVDEGPIRITGVRSGAADGVQQLGFQVVSLDDSITTSQLVEGFPVPMDGTVPAGTEIGNGDYWLLIGYQVETTGRWERRGLVIEYEQGGAKFEQTFPATLIVCGTEVAKADCTD